MKKTLLLSALTLFAIGCEGVAAPPEEADVLTETAQQGLGAAPTNPVTVTPTVPTTGINGTRSARTPLEPHTWQACVTKTTATCTTGSGGVGAVCGTSAPCNTSLFCVGGVCVAPIGLGGTCVTNNQCGVYSGTQLACVITVCAQRSGLLGPCDEVADCLLPASPDPTICMANTCRYLGNLGDPCQTALHCKTTTSGGQPMTCIVPSGQTIGACQQLGGVGGPCTDEFQCNQSTAPRCIPTTPTRTCNILMPLGGLCDSAPDCNQTAAPSGVECIASTCRAKGTVGTSCGINSNCNSPLVCINSVCNNTSNTNGPCDEMLDCTQVPSQQGCVSGVCRVSGILNGPCGPSFHCGNDPACINGQNSTGAMVCISIAPNNTCLCPSTTICGENADCALQVGGGQSVCVPNLAPTPGKMCRAAGTTTGGCCDEKVDCRPIGASTCWLGLQNLGCNSGGECVVGLLQGQTCVSTDQCTGSLICKINTLIPGRTYTTCEF